MVDAFVERRPKTTKNEHFQECLFFFKRNSSYFLRCFITVGETCIHHYTTEWKQQSNHIGMVGESAQRKAKRVQSTGKVMAAVFWYSHGVVLTD